MLTPEQVQSFKSEGYLVGPQVYGDDETDQLLTRMYEILEGKRSGAESNRNMLEEKSKRVVHQIVNTWEADELFRNHLYNEILCNCMAQLMETDVVRVWHDQIQYKPARIGGPTNWHQDHPYWPIIQPPELISAWLALEDATIENGCMWMVPKSHTWGTYLSGTIPADDETFDPVPDQSLLPENAQIIKVPCEVKKGQVMFHHCLTWHGSPCNNSDKGRPAIAVHYMPGYTRYEPQGSHIMQHRVTVEPGEILQGEHFPTVWDNGPVFNVTV